MVTSVPRDNAVFYILSNNLPKMSIKNESKIVMLIAEHLGPDSGSMAGYWTGFKANQVIRLDLNSWFHLTIVGIKRLWPGHVT